MVKLFISLLAISLLAPAFAGQLGDENVSNVLFKAPAFVGSYSATPTQVVVGNSVTLNATITDRRGSLSNGNVTLEIYNSSNQRIFQKYFTNQSFAAGGSKSYTATWSPTSAGTYTYQVGVFNQSWSTAYLWNVAATITAVCPNP
jgi:hypothetical protein